MFPRRMPACEEAKAVPLTPDELSEWQRTFRVWQSVGDVSELAEIMATLEPDERAQVWQTVCDSGGVRSKVEALLGSSG